MKAAEIRKTFIEYFKSKGHSYVDSSSLIPSNDPTLLFTNAGMVQFKELFLGLEKREYTTATSYQKCVRAGGKHNDLDNVGFTARHHTFFEMLGNFSFGEYFKEQAIDYAWDFITNVIKVPKDKLYVTVFEKDDEAEKIWHEQQSVPMDRIVRLGEADNFWSMGDTGPCGPCTEIFYDLGPEVGCKTKECKVGCDCDRYMEFWNLVFMQYDRNEKGDKSPLPKPSVDTGMGLERIALILQGKKSNYETDLFSDIFSAIEALSGKKNDPSTPEGVAFRVVADHARATSFLISDGVIPSNEGRGYVLRRIIRRAIRYGKQLGFEKPFLNEICVAVIDQMVAAYPDLASKKSFVQKCVAAEEEQFLRTLAKGLDILDAELKGLTEGGVVSGDVVFRLYDTYGFPADLTALIARENGLSINETRFAECMEEQKSRSRKNWKGSGDSGVASAYHGLFESFKEKSTLQSFCGYDENQKLSKLIGIVVTVGKGKEAVQKVVEKVSSTDKFDMIEVFLSETPFYGESGGQIGDRGQITAAGTRAHVLDVQKPIAELVSCRIKMVEGSLEVGQNYEQSIDLARRSNIRRNHTATHLLHHALRSVLGDHVQQAGSLVSDELLRFDFTHFQGVDREQLDKIESLVNEQLWLGGEVKSESMSKDEATGAGAIAFFGEKYGDEVRVISAGQHSVELCGGTHVNNLSEIQLFKIASEGAIASGVRRVIAYTSAAAYKYLDERARDSLALRQKFQVKSSDELLTKIDKLVESEKSLRKEVDSFAQEKLVSEVNRLISSSTPRGTTTVINALQAPDAKGVKYLRDYADLIRGNKPDSIAVLGMRLPEKNKAFVLVAVGNKAPKELKANEIIAKIAPMINGRGGGKPDLAQAGGDKLDGLEQALAAAEEMILSQL